MTQKHLPPCNEPPVDPTTLNQDPPVPFCADDGTPNLNRVGSELPDIGWFQENLQKKSGSGSADICDPQTKGFIYNDLNTPDRDVIYRYSRAIRGADEAMRDLFSDIVIIDENSKIWPVPIIWATQERAVAWILQANVRKDNSLVVDRIRLPHLAIHATSYTFAPKRYIYHKAVDYTRDLKEAYREKERESHREASQLTKPAFTTQEKYKRDTVFGRPWGIPIDITYQLVAWALYEEDMNEILEQIMPKIAPMGYIRVRGVPQEIGVKLTSIANNVDTNPGDQKMRVFKYQFEMVAESYMPLPIVRKKALLKTRVAITDGIGEDTSLVIERIENAVKELDI